jgi:hypothetical protein
MARPPSVSWGTNLARFYFVGGPNVEEEARDEGLDAGLPREHVLAARRQVQHDDLGVRAVALQHAGHVFCRQCPGAYTRGRTRHEF